MSKSGQEVLKTLALSLGKSLENSEFELDVHGTAYEGSSSLSKAAEIKGTTISITVTNDNSLDPFFTIVGTLDEPILADKDTKQKVTFADQLIYFGKKDESTPHHLDADGELKHTSVWLHHSNNHIKNQNQTGLIIDSFLFIR